MTLGARYLDFRERGGLMDLSGRARFHLTGPDRVRYLNGQISNDVRGLPAGEARRACIMTAKGRLCAHIWYSATPDFLRVDAAGALREPLAARLERYIVADDVELVDAGESERLFHVLGPAAESVAGNTGATAARADRLGIPGWDIHVFAGEAEPLWQQLEATLPVVDDALQKTLRIEAGIPAWGAELSEETLPPEAGLDITAIDYHKGCYIGQEVISRLKSIGHVNRQLRGLLAPADDAGLDLQGAILHDPGDPEKEAGRITSAAYSFALARPAALGYVKRAVTAGTLLARLPDGRSVEVEVRPLPLIP